MKNIFISLFLFAVTSSAFATDYYCDPVNGDMQNSGTSLNTPWASLREVFDLGKTFSPGDVIYLLSGNHGTVTIKGRNTDYVTIQPAEGAKPTLSFLIVNNGTYWIFKGLTITSMPTEQNYNVYSVSDKYFLVQTDKYSEHIKLESCNIYTTDEDISSWTRMDWFTKTMSGIMVRSKYTYINNCTIKNTNFALEVHGKYSEFTSSTIENFVGDAIRALASYCKYEYNTVKNSYDVTGYDNNNDGSNPDYPVGPGNHDDLFQSYTSIVGNGETGLEYIVTNVTVRNNIFLSYTDPNQIDKSYTQGIACFDGYFEDWIVENNIIVTDSWHGITFLGVNNSKFANNTVLQNPIDNDLVLGDGSVVNDMTPFIWIGKMKDIYGSGASNDNIVRNNLIIESNFGGSGYNNIIDDGTNTTKQNNLTIPTGSESSYFVDFNNFNLKLKSGSPAIDQGINIDLPLYDISLNDRLVGSKVDCGAYEYNDGTSSNNCPVINPVGDQTAQADKTTIINISATDADGDVIALTMSNLQSFMSFKDNGDGTGMLTITPVNDNIGEYSVTLTASDGTNSNQFSFKVSVIEPTGVFNSNKKTENFIVYPNPVTLGEFVHVELNNVQNTPVSVKVFDVNGRLVHEQSMLANNISIDTSYLQKGIYLVNINKYNSYFVIN